MEITVSQAEGHKPITVLHVQGNIDSTSYEQFESRAEEAINGGTHDLLIDLQRVPYMSSAGLRALNQIYNRLRTENEDKDSVSKGVSAGTYKSPHLKLLAPSHRVMETLKMSGFDMFLEIHSDLESALDSF
jgi:anti-anti-sigma factor